ncbi:MAG: phosphoglycerate dehydrogenase [Rhodobacteraceae bacterium]|nr:phosphoglycerate dehydrogenase [Paracoccaceae bacterium]
MTTRVLLSDRLSQTAVEIFRERGIKADFRPGIGRDAPALASIIDGYDGLAVRSATRVTAELLARARRLKVVGRAGIGIDNIDLGAATRHGVIVMNTPFGNSETTAEHAIALMFSVARQIPQANQSTKSGKWEKSRFLGSELIGKTIGVVGCGNVGSAVCRRALGLGMKVIGHDPFLSVDRARQIGIEKVAMDELLARSDFVTIHVPLNAATRNLIDASALRKTRVGVRIVNCARGGIVDEAALLDAVRSGQVAGAALDVFEREPPHGNPLLDLPQVIATPHLGASTTEAQEKVAVQVAEQMSDFLLNGAVSNAINMPSMSAEEASRLKPWINLATHLGSFVGQMTSEPIRSLNLLYDGAAARMNTDALSAVAIASILKVSNPDVNMVSAETVAKERGIVVSSTKQTKSGVFDAYIRLTIETDSLTRTIVGTVFSDGRPRFIQIKGIYVDAGISRHMLYTTNTDKPGMIGKLGTILGKHDVNIANFNLGRSEVDQDAIALLSLDTPVPQIVVEELSGTGLFRHVSPLRFDVQE